MRWLLASDRAAAEPLGGMTVVLTETGRRLADAGEEVHWITGRLNDSLPVEGSWRDLHVHSFPFDGRLGAQALRRARCAIRQRTERLLEEGDVEASIVHQPVAGLAAGPLLKQKEVSSCYFFHSPWGEEFRLAAGRRRILAAAGARVRRFLESRALAFFDRVAVLSESMAEWLRREHPNAPQPFMVTPGVDLERFRPVDDLVQTRQALGWPDEGPVLLSVRRLVPRTGVDLLLEAFSQVVSHHPTAKLLMGGRGRLRAALEQYTYELGISDRVCFLGYLSDEQLPLALAAADIVVIPTRALEGLGLVTLEALAAGTPVVATPVGGNVELLEPFHPELLASETTSEALAHTLQRMLSMGADHLHQLGTQARAHVQDRYGWERTTADLKSILEIT